MNDNNPNQESIDQLIDTIATGFKALHEDNNQREDLLKKQFELQLKVQDKKNQKWRLGSILGGLAILALGYNLHKVIYVFEDDMDTMSAEIVDMSTYMKSMSVDITSMSGDISSMKDSMAVMSPEMVSMAKDMHIMGRHIGSMDSNMSYMSRDMGQMNRAMSPFMGNMQKFVPGRW